MNIKTENLISSIVRATMWQHLPGYQRFLNEMSNNKVNKSDAIKIVSALESGLEVGSIPKVTNVNQWTCRKVIDTAYKYDLLKR